MITTGPIMLIAMAAAPSPSADPRKLQTKSGASRGRPRKRNGKGLRKGKGKGKRTGSAVPFAKERKSRKGAPRRRRVQRTRTRTAEGKHDRKDISAEEVLAPAKEASASPPVERDEGRDAYEAGYERGLYEGGEQLLEQVAPHDALLPEISLRDVVAAGLAAIAPQSYPLADVGLVFEELTQAIKAKQPYALVRLGDGELLTLAQDVVHDVETIRREGRFLPYAGVTPPDFAARDLVATAVRQVNRVGVPLSRRKHFQPLLHPVLRSHGIDPAGLRLTSSTVNYALQQSGLLPRLFSGRRLLLIGDKSPALGEALAARGFAISGVISPVNGFASIDRVIHEASLIDYDLALVSAGVPAVVICWRLAAETGSVAIDFGHLADAIVKGQISI